MYKRFLKSLDADVEPYVKYGLGILSVGLFGVVLYKLVRSNKKKRLEVNENGALSKNDLIMVAEMIKNTANPHLKIWRENHRRERRKYFNDEKEYHRLIDQYNTRLALILTDASEKTFKEYDITKAIFEDSIHEYKNDEDVSTLINSLATVKDNNNAMKDISKDKLLEILHYHNKRENLLSSQPSMHKIEYITTRLEDEIYFQFKVEMEDIAAAYIKHDCFNDRDFQKEINEMEESIFQFQSPNILSPKNR